MIRVRSFGIVASVVLLVIVAWALYVVVRSIPDLARYRRLRRM